MRALLLLLIGCQAETLPGPVTPDPDEGDFTPVGPVDVAEDGLIGRDFRRMDIGQLSRSIEVVTGHRWTRTNERGEVVDRFEELAPTLGVADYVEVVADPMDPSLLFQKFLDDAALDVCPRMVADDLARADGQRWLMTRIAPDVPVEYDLDGMRGTLQDAVLRFHGKALADDAPELEEWLFLARSLDEVASTPERRWQALCIALVTHPDFYLY